MTYNFTYYDGGRITTANEVRIRRTSLLIGREVWERLGQPEYITVEADKLKRAIRVSPGNMSPHSRKLVPMRNGKNPPKSYSFYASSLSRDLPQGRYFPLPEDPNIFIHSEVLE